MSKRLRDPVHGLIVFDEDDAIDRLAWSLIDTPEFQRLRRIRQLGFTSLAYPGAEHTRFAHAIGTAHVMQRLVRRLRELQTSLPPEHRLTATLVRDALAAALLHDIGHGPLSHMFEEAMPRADPTAPGPLRLVALGAMGRARGWPAALDAIARAADRTIRLEVVGPFTDGSAGDFARAAARLGITGRVSATGGLPRSEALARAAEAHAALVLFAPGPANHDAALPHKLFEAMALGLPVVVAATSRPAAALVRRTGCGLVVDSGDPDAIATALDALAADPEARGRMGEAGRRALTADYAWEEDAGRLAWLHRRLARRAGGAPRGARAASGSRHG